MEERARLKRGLADISHLFFVSTDDNAPPTAISVRKPEAIGNSPAAFPPLDMTGLVGVPELDRRLDWLSAFSRGLLMAGVEMTVLKDRTTFDPTVEPDTEYVPLLVDHSRPRILSTGPPDLSRLSITDSSLKTASSSNIRGRSKHPLFYWNDEPWPQSLERASRWCNRLLVVLPPEISAFIRFYQSLKKMGGLRGQRVHYYLVAARDVRVDSMQEIDEAWQAVAGRFLNAAVHCLGHIGPAGDRGDQSVSTIIYEPLWAGLRHLIRGADTPLPPPCSRDALLAWAIDQDRSNRVMATTIAKPGLSMSPDPAPQGEGNNPVKMLYQDRPSLGRNQIMALLRQRLDRVLGCELRSISEEPVEAPFVDFLALDDDATLYAVHWLEPGEWQTRLHELILAHDRMRRDTAYLLRRFTIDQMPPSLSLAWIFVGLALPENWTAVSTLLAFPMVFLKVHLLTGGEGARNMVYFELFRADTCNEPAGGIRSYVEPAPGVKDESGRLTEIQGQSTQADDSDANGNPAAQFAPPNHLTDLDVNEMSAFDRLHGALRVNRHPFAP
ncbi:MAG: hypothetical protein M1457_12690 [bacterium]|nr:hypothetical protein [bacterium]